MSNRARRVKKNFNQRILRQFSKSFAGEIILPGDRSYPRVRRVWNHAVNRYPRLIARCTNPDDVIRAIHLARDHDLPAAVRSGGHSFAGHGVCDDGILIDLSPMTQVKIDPMNKSVRIAPGVLGNQLDHITQAFKLAVPLGSCPSTGVVGYALGGGTGSLTPKFGYGCDHITQCELITADGRKVTASEREEKDLFWALRGAGANFGIVTSLELRLDPIEQVLSGHLKYPIRHATKVLAFIEDYVSGIPDELYLLMAVLPHPGERMLNIGVVWPGEPRRGEKVLSPLRKFLKPVEDTIQVRAYLDEQRAGSDNPGDGEYSTCRRAGHLENLSPECIEVIVDHAANAPTEASGITLVYWHGQWCSKPRDDAFGFRRSGYHYWIHSYWQQSKAGPQAQRWVHDFFSALAPLSTGAVYVNDLQEEGEERVRAAYADKYERLCQIKSEFDPTNFFCVNQNIRPALNG